MVGLGILFAALATAMVLAPDPGSSQFECEADHQCMVNNFCYKKRFCVECYKCSVYNREPSPITSCAKTVFQCGKCIKGYMEEILLTSDARGLCVLANPSTATTVVIATFPSLDENINITSKAGNITGAGVILSALIGSLIGIAIILSICVWMLKKLKDARPESPDIESLHDRVESLNTPPPPPYNCCVTPLLQLPAASQPVADPRPDLGIISGRFEVQKQVLQQAVPFVKPQPTYAISEDEDEVEVLADAEIIIHHSPTPPDLVDEDTMPSTWIPESGDDISVADHDSVGLPNDSGVSMQSSENNSTTSLSEPIGARGTIGILTFPCRRSFIGISAQDHVSVDVSSTARRGYDSDENAVPAKRLRRDSGPPSMSSHSMPESSNSQTGVGQPVVVTNITNHVCVNILQ